MITIAGHHLHGTLAIGKAIVPKDSQELQNFEQWRPGGPAAEQAEQMRLHG